MGCPRLVVDVPFRIWVASAADVWESLGGVVGIAGATAFDYRLTVSRITGNVRAIPAAQLIEARDDVPGSPTAAGATYATAVGSTHHSTDLTAATDRYLARVGVLANLSGGTTAGYVEGRLAVYVAQCHTVIGQRRIEIPAAQTNGAPTTVVIGRVPAPSADKVRAAVVATDVKDVEYVFAVRGVNDPEAPGSWVVLNAGTYTALVDGNSATCASDKSVSTVVPGNYHDLDVGFRFRTKAAGSNPTGVLRVAAAMSYT